MWIVGDAGAQLTFFRPGTESRGLSMSPAVGRWSFGSLQGSSFRQKVAALDDTGGVKVGTPGKSEAARSHPLRRMPGQGRAGLAQPVQTSQGRASQIWLSGGGWAGGVALTQGLASQVTAQGQLLPGCF